MKYIEINIDTTIAGIEPVIDQLYVYGITDIVVEDPRDVLELMEKKVDYQWDYLSDEVVKLKDEKPKITVFAEESEEGYEKAKTIAKAMKALKEAEKAGNFGEEADFGSLKVLMETADDSDWKDKWKEYFKPAKVSERIVVKPTWEDYQNEDDDLVIEIDPGMAFGTGTHETTSLCIKMMEKYLKKEDKVLDVGCGSGILSIGAALLGSKDILGIEIDPIAVDVAKENVALNKVDDVVKIQYGDLTKGIDFKANVVVANLMADLVQLLSADVASHMEDQGIYISSGILVEKEVLVADTIRSCGFKILEVREDGIWCAIVAQKG